tara:strand:- start:2 stop:259 length:258 start_codon:yes stop_codon:yes gene_type:complete
MMMDKEIDFDKFSDEIDEFGIKILEFCKESNFHPEIAAVGMHLLSMDLLKSLGLLNNEQVKGFRRIVAAGEHFTEEAPEKGEVIH